MNSVALKLRVQRNLRILHFISLYATEAPDSAVEDEAFASVNEPVYLFLRRRGSCDLFRRKEVKKEQPFKHVDLHQIRLQFQHSLAFKYRR